MKRKLIIATLATVASLCLAFGIAGCADNESESSSSSKWGDVFTIEAAYAQAEELGYTGTLEEFIATISGKDGVGIADVYIKSSQLYVELDDGTVINCGVVNTTTACDHDYGDWQTAVEATCTSIGYDTRTCSLCGDIDYNFTAATGHSFADNAEYEVYATTHTSFCSDCGLYVAEAHDFDDGGDCATCGLGLKYELNSDGKSYTVTGVTSESAIHAIVIPDEHNGFPVTDIQEDAFYENTTISSVIISDSVTSIGKLAFYGCTSLKSVTIGSGSIGEFAFRYCTSLISVTIGSGVTSIGDDAFEDCTSLTSVTIGSGVISIGDYAFNICTSLTSITIPDSVTSIGNGAFYNCTSLTEINVDNDNKDYCSIDGVLFSKDRTELITYPVGRNDISYTIPDSVTSIGDDAFRYCTSLTSITIPNSVTSIGNYAFRYCTSLTSIKIPDSVISIGNYAFEGCTSLTSITIGNSVTSIGEYAFYNCTSLTSITIPNSVTYIGSYAFDNCTSLTSVTFENTEGWWVSTSSSATSGTSISSSDLADTSTAATYLTSTYRAYYWKRG